MDGESLFDRLYLPARAARVAVLSEHAEITYEELRDRTIGAAEALNALDIRAGERVGLMLSDSPEFIASFVAIISLGAIAVPINLALRRADQLFILKDCGASAAIIEAKAAENLFQADEIQTDLKNLLVVSRDRGSVAASIAGLDAQAFDRAKRAPLGDVFPVRGSEDADAFILYTSGSTGEPKGAVHRQADIFYTNETFCSEV